MKRNPIVVLLVSIATTQDADEVSQAAAFVGVAQAEPARVPAILSVPEIERLLHLYVPSDEAEAILTELLGGKSPRELSLPDLLDMRIRFERMLAATGGQGTELLSERVARAAAAGEVADLGALDHRAVLDQMRRAVA